MLFPVAQSGVRQLKEKLLESPVAEDDFLNRNSVLIKGGKCRSHIFLKSLIPADAHNPIFNEYPPMPAQCIDDIFFHFTRPQKNGIDARQDRLF